MVSFQLLPLVEWNEESLLKTSIRRNLSHINVKTFSLLTGQLDTNSRLKSPQIHSKSIFNDGLFTSTIALEHFHIMEEGTYFKHHHELKPAIGGAS